MIALTAAICLALLTYAWRTIADHRPLARIAMGALLGGAVGNLVDRATDGVVTDYLHTGWFPTFNLDDAYIVVGVATLAVTHLAAGPRSGTAPAREQARR